MLKQIILFCVSLLFCHSFESAKASLKYLDPGYFLGKVCFMATNGMTNPPLSHTNVPQVRKSTNKPLYHSFQHRGFWKKRKKNKHLFSVSGWSFYYCLPSSPCLSPHRVPGCSETAGRLAPLPSVVCWGSGLCHNYWAYFPSKVWSTSQKKG